MNLVSIVLFRKLVQVFSKIILGELPIVIQAKYDDLEDESVVFTLDISESMQKHIQLLYH